MLTDAKCRNATCPTDKARARFTDAAGLYLEISPAGSKRWFWLLTERWLVEVTVPTKSRIVNSKSSFFVSLTAEEREVVLAGGSLPADKLLVPDSWRKVPVAPVPAAAHEPAGATA